MISAQSQRYQVMLSSQGTHQRYRDAHGYARARSLHDHVNVGHYLFHENEVG